MVEIEGKILNTSISILIEPIGNMEDGIICIDFNIYTIGDI